MAAPGEPSAPTPPDASPVQTAESISPDRIPLPPPTVVPAPRRAAAGPCWITFSP